ncbi:bestrophin family protein [Mucilaginibacter pedocola]|uniref:Hydrogenase n=1 Tax=Mucilaginibacter pedocola TaxID=1792845 RepID=A0A1S9P8U9_9SPHI|nr:bestrophin family ion channel [Mucilaginibacter pedocola]OOQ57339.1 hypothetical protein BC343_14635 [Mucilaginibacter pedocola]
MLLKKQISVNYFINLIKWDVLAIVVYATLVGSLDHVAFLKDISIPLSISALIATLLSLLLAFRTSQSYERWWEARTIWGAIVNDSRTLIRQLILFIPEDTKKQEYIRSFASRQAIWCYALSENLRKVSFSEKVNAFFSKLGKDSDNRPNLILSQHAEELANIGMAYNLNANKLVQIDATIARLTDSMGKCERIKNTVLPRSYSMLIHFLIYVLMTMLPFGLEDNHWIIEIVITTIVPVLFIAIERTAILMQDPFENKPTDTPMTTLSATIERNLMEMSGQPAPATAVNSADYYIM